MEKLELFLKKNKVKRENIQYPATTSLVDENGEPLLWELRAVTTKENNKLVDEAVRYIGQADGETKATLDNVVYTRAFITAAVVFPDLHNKALQDSYGVMTPEELLEEMIDSPDEFAALAKKVKELSGISKKQEAAEVSEAKN